MMKTEKDASKVEVVPYRREWKTHFTALAELLAGVDAPLEHVGSTSVPDLAAKPVIDADLILEDWSRFAEIREQLAGLGFIHRGDLGVPGREAFSSSSRLPFAHHLYVCRAGVDALKNHLKLRDYLRSHPADAKRYGALKQQLARQFPNDVDSYCEAKSGLIAEFLAAAGMDADAIEGIRKVNCLT